MRHVLCAVLVVFLLSCGGKNLQMITQEPGNDVQVKERTVSRFNRHQNATAILAPVVNAFSPFKPEYYIYAISQSIVFSPRISNITKTNILYVVSIRLRVRGIQYGTGWSRGRPFDFISGDMKFTPKALDEAMKYGFVIQLPKRNIVLHIPANYFIGFEKKLPCRLNQEANCIFPEQVNDHFSKSIDKVRRFFARKSEYRKKKKELESIIKKMKRLSEINI